MPVVNCTCMVIYLYRMVFSVCCNVCHGYRNGGRVLTLLTGGSQVLEQITSKHLLFVPSSSPNSSHIFLCCFHLTFRPARAAQLVTVRSTLWLSLRGCWMCWPTRLMWQWLCRGGAHFRDLTVLLLLLFPLLQCMLLGAGCFLWKLRCFGVHMLKLEC